MKIEVGRIEVFELSPNLYEMTTRNVVVRKAAQFNAFLVLSHLRLVSYRLKRLLFRDVPSPTGEESSLKRNQLNLHAGYVALRQRLFGKTGLSTVLEI